MNSSLLTWDIYEISSEAHELTGVKLRGRLRKWGIDAHINLLTENAQDAPGRVRFALLTGTDSVALVGHIRTMVADACIEKKLSATPNPVLSKLQVNMTDRYS